MVIYLSQTYLKDMLRLPIQTNMRIMPPIVSPSDPVSVAVDEMIKQNIGATIVVKAGQPVGILTEKDLLELIKAQKDLTQTLVKDVMSKPLISIEANRSMKDALDLMREHNIRRLAVTKGGTLVGLVTERRLLEIAFLVT